MLPLIVAIFVASLLGSAHCVGMCGAFVAFAVGSSDGRAAAPSRARLNAAYNGGRLVTYVLLGVVAGAFGAALDLGGTALGVQRGAMVAAGAFMVAFALVSLARSLGVRVPRAPLPRWLHRVVAAGHRVAFEMPPTLRALTIGLLTTLLPCGWLYAFAVAAAGTGSPWIGAIVMAAFWCGTLPALAALGFGIQSLAGPLRRKLPALTAVLMAAVGVWTLLGRFNVPALSVAAAGAGVATAGACASTSERTVEQTIAEVGELDHAKMPCCHGAESPGDESDAEVGDDEEVEADDPRADTQAETQADTQGERSP